MCICIRISIIKINIYLSKYDIMFIPPLIIFLNPPLRGLYQDKIIRMHTYIRGSGRKDEIQVLLGLGIKGL